MFLEIDTILTPIVDFIITLSLRDDNEQYKDLLVEFKRNHKLAVTIRVLRTIRLIRIVKLYKAAVVFMRNLENKNRIMKLKEKIKQKEEMIRKRELKKINVEEVSEKEVKAKLTCKI